MLGVSVGPCPVFCCFAVFFEAKRKSGWGICGSLWFGFCVSCFWFALICHSYGPYVSFYSQIFTAYAIVRTEPRALSATQEKKNAAQPRSSYRQMHVRENWVLYVSSRSLLELHVRWCEVHRRYWLRYWRGVDHCSLLVSSFGR